MKSFTTRFRGDDANVAAGVAVVRATYLHEDSHLPPGDTCGQASRRAADPGISRSGFFARAARRYLDELASHSITRQVDDALQDAVGDGSGAAAAAAGRSYLAGQDDW